MCMVAVSERAIHISDHSVQPASHWISDNLHHLDRSAVAQVSRIPSNGIAMPSSDLLNLGRTLHVGVLLMGGTTELLDIAPLDLIHHMARGGFVHNFPDEIIPPNLKAQALDIKSHWVNETGEPAKLTGGMNVEVTVGGRALAA